MQTIIAYNENEVKEQKEFSNIEPKDKAWIDLIDPTDEMIKSISSHFDLDQSAVNLFNSKSKKPQIRVLDEHTFTILLDIKFNNSQTVVTEGVYLFCGKNWLITIHSAEVDLTKSIRKLLEVENKKLMIESIEALFYSVLSQLIDRYEQVLTAVELTITDLEEKALSEPARETIRYLATLSRQLIVFRRHFWRMRDVVNFLSHMEKDQNEVKYIQMAYDNISHLVELVESYRDTINSVRDLYIANISLEMNDTMRTLTIFATILLPLTLVATIYGMNGLDLNSLSKLPSGFIIVIVTMIIITGSLFFLFSKKKWIIFRRNKALPKDNPKTLPNH
ncbi:MAG TPA: magnesium transporter CorA family protein [Nitrososphaeraceae archaeon]